MRAAVLRGVRSFEVARVAEPELAPGEVLLRVSGCGVCGSNLAPWTGETRVEYPLPPGAPGHEVYGTVAALGEGVRGLAVGDAVTALAQHSFAELDRAPARDVLRLPASLAGRPVVGEPLACAVNVVARAGIREGDTVVVIGIGFLGALVLQLARREGPAHLVAVSRRSDGRELAARWGADSIFSFEEDVESAVSAATRGRLADVVIEATGRSGPLDRAARLTRTRGRLVIAGYHQTGRVPVDLQLWNWRGLDVVNAHERDLVIYRRGMREGVDLLERGELELEPLLTHSFPLGEIDRAFDTAAARPSGFMKAIVTTEAV